MPLNSGFISTIYHKILHLLAMSSTTSNSQLCEIPLGCVPIQVYCDRLQAEYKLEGLARMEKCYVEEIKLYKEISGKSKHEYLVAKVKAPDGTSFFLAFERGRGETIDKATHEEGDDDIIDASSQTPSQPPSLPDDSLAVPASGTLAPLPEPASQSCNHAASGVLPPSLSNFKFFHIPPSSPSTLASLNSSLRRRNADDKVTFVEQGNRKGKHMLFRTLFFCEPTMTPTLPSSSISESSPSGPLPSSSSSAPPPPRSYLHLYELAVLANSIHTTKPEYLLFSDNCYFYAGTIIKVLQEKYAPRIKVEAMDNLKRLRWLVLKWKGFKLEGKPEGKGKGKDRKAGDWHHVEIYDGAKVNTAPLIEKFQKYLLDFKKPIQDHEDKRKAKEVQLEAVKAELVRMKGQLQDHEDKWKAEKVQLEEEKAAGLEAVKAELVRVEGQLQEKLKEAQQM